MDIIGIYNIDIQPTRALYWLVDSNGRNSPLHVPTMDPYSTCSILEMAELVNSRLIPAARSPSILHIMRVLELFTQEYQPLCFFPGVA